MRYWRDPDTGDVIKSSADAPADPGDVIVIPEADWRRLLEYMGSWQCGCCCEDPCVACQEDAAAAAIIQRTEEANDA